MILIALFCLIQVSLSFNINIYNSANKYLGSINSKNTKCVQIKDRAFSVTKEGRVIGWEKKDCTGLCKVRFDFKKNRGTESIAQNICLGDITFKAVKEPITACKGVNQWKRKGRCFTLFSTPKNWDKAQTKCARFGLSLATLRNTADNYKLVKSIKSKVWIGLNDKAKEGTFTWASGASTLKMWSPNQPDGAKKQNCVEVSPIDGKWNDENCAVENSYICSVDAKKVRMPQPYCAESNQITHKGKCFTVLSKARNWKDASTACTQRGYTLASIRDDKEQQKVVSMITVPSVWIGLNDNAVEGKWQWQGASTSTFKNWKVGQPNGGPQQNCVAMLSKDSWRWSDKDCQANEYNPLCEVPVSKLPLPHKIVIKGRSFFYFPLKRSFQQASAICQANGLALATIRNLVDNNVLNAAIGNGNNKNDIWIGLINKGKGWEWVSSTSTFKNWAGPAPQTSGEACATMTFDKATWTHISCREYRPFLCYSDRVTIPFRYDEGDWWSLPKK